MSSLNATSDSHFYYYGHQVDKVPKGPFLLGQRITTRLPEDILKAKIRIVTTFVLTTAVVLGITGSTLWSWPVLILGLSFAAYTAYKHLLTRDPLVDVFYRIAGGEAAYNNLPEIRLDPLKKTYENFDRQIRLNAQKKTHQIFHPLSWQELVHSVYRLTTADGRKGMLVKGLTYSEEPFLYRDESPSLVYTQARLIFVEKFNADDIPNNKSSGILAINTHWHCEKRFPSQSLGARGKEYIFQDLCRIYSFMTTDMANEFIAQRELQD